MKKAHIIFIDDQIDVLSSLRNDLDIFRKKFILDDCESADEAWDLLEEVDADGESVALILSDHVMPNKSGIDFLSEVANDDRFEKIPRVLITGQASHSDTINAINNASINSYISKPWSVEKLHDIVKKIITDWVVDNDLNHQDFEGLIDPEVLFNRIKN